MAGVSYITEIRGEGPEGNSDNEPEGRRGSGGKGKADFPD